MSKNSTKREAELSAAESKSGMQHYDKVRKLGQGSFGSVFLMKDRRDDALCVMKAIDLDQLDAKGKQVQSPVLTSHLSTIFLSLAHSVSFI